MTISRTCPGATAILTAPRRANAVSPATVLAAAVAFLLAFGSSASAQVPDTAPDYALLCSDCSGTEYFGELDPADTDDCQSYELNVFENWTAGGGIIAASQTDIVEVNETSDADFWYYQVVTRASTWSSVLVQSLNLELAFGNCSDAATRFQLLASYTTTSDDVGSTWEAQGDAQVKFYRDTSTLNNRIGDVTNDGPATPGGDTSDYQSNDDGYDSDVNVAASDAYTRLHVDGGSATIEIALRRSAANLLAVANPFTPCFGRAWTGQTSTISKDKFAINDQQQTDDFSSSSWAVDNCAVAANTDPCDPAPDCTGSDTACGEASCDAGGLPGNCDILTPRAAGTECRAATGDCDIAETCDGANIGACPADVFVPAETACGTSDDSICDNPDSCDGAGTCLPNNEPGTTECRADAGPCDVAEFCDGAGACPADAFEPADTACGSPSDTECDNPDSCDGGGNCLVNNEPGTTECRADAGDCDVAEFCDGAGACPADAFEPAATACGSLDDSICDDPDTCDGAGTCLANNEPGTTECRTDTGECDIAEFCDGAGTCPADAFEPAETACGSPDATVCDNPDFCDGGGNCLVNNEPSTTECRANTGDCDVAEFCDGAGACPADAFEPPATACGSSDDTVCDNPDSCDGAGTCLANNEPGTLECRAVAGPCDVAESCDGAGTCPANGFVSSDTECRAPAGPCDQAENCSGSSAECPSDLYAASGTECRPPAGGCDIAETCDGVTLECPVDEIQAVDAECRPAAGACDIAETCDGSSGACPDDAFEPASLECRASGGVCGVAENCTGSSAECPPDAFVPAATTCRASASTCDATEACTGSAAECPADAPLPNGSTCEDGNACTTSDSCQGGSCEPGSPLDCDDVDLCTLDSCDEETGCVYEPWVREEETCHHAAAGRLVVADRTLARKDVIRWTWKKGEPTTSDMFGAPGTTTGYSLCIFDQAGGATRVATSLAIPPNAPFWKPIKKSRARYIDRPGSFDGVRRMRLQARSLPLQSKVTVRAKGGVLPLPVPAGEGTLFETDPTLIVQFVNDDDGCWSSEFTPADARRNRPTKYVGTYR